MDKIGLSLTDRVVAGKIPRKTLEFYLDTQQPPEEEVLNLELSERLHEAMGTFVTLKKEGKLRGCVGHILSTDPIWQEIRDVAILSATKDTRFQPVEAHELPDLSISISVLSPPSPANDPYDFQVGLHGIIFQLRDRRALFLPQVATELGWDKETTFRQLARKARLPDDAWKDPDARFFLFQGQVFDENGAETKDS